MENVSSPSTSVVSLCDKYDEKSLDGMFKTLLLHLDDIISTKAEGDLNMNLIGKWVNRFIEIPTNEKYARNCLLILMLDQLHKQSKLSQPFTDNVDSSNCNLNQVFKNVEKGSEEMVENVLDHLVKKLGKEDVPLLIVRVENEVSTDALMGPNINLSNAKPISIITNGCQESNLIIQNAMLCNEVESLRRQLGDQNVKNLSLTSKLAKNKVQYKKSTERKSEEMKQNILEAVEQFLTYQRGKDDKTLNLFETVLGVFSKNTEFIEKLREYDLKLEDIIKRRAQFVFTEAEYSIRKEASEMESKKCQRMVEQFQSGLRMQSWAQQLEIQYLSLKLISELRDIILRFSTDDDRKALLEALHNLEMQFEVNNVQI